MKNKKFLKISLIYYVCTILVCLVFVFGYWGKLKSEPLSSFLIQIVAMLAIPLIAYTTFVSKNYTSTLEDCGIKKISGKMLLTTILIGFILFFLNGFVANFFQSILNLFGWENLHAQFGTNYVKFNYGIIVQDFILTAILPAVCEEFLHRGIMLHAGKKVANTHYCLIISSLLFGCMHLNIVQFGYASVLGYVFGVVSLISGSILPSMILHFANNALSVYLYYGDILGWAPAKKYLSLRNMLNGNKIENLLITTLILIFFICALIYLLKLLQKQRASYEINKIIKHLNLTKMPFVEAQQKVQEVNLTIKKTNNRKFMQKQKPNYPNNIFVISSFVLSGLITFCTFLWGLL